MSEGSESIVVTRRRLLGGLVTIGGAGAATGMGTMAYFTDSESSTGNIIKAGTLNLGFDDSGTFEFSTSLAPGQSVSDAVTLVSDGTVDGSVDVDVDYSENDAQDPPETDMSASDVAENLEVTNLTYGGDPIDDQIDTSNSPPTLQDLANNAHDASEETQNDIINLGDPGDGTDFGIEFTLKDVGNDYQGDGIDVKFTFHLNQTDGQ